MKPSNSARRDGGVFLIPEGSIKRPKNHQATLITMLFLGLLLVGMINLYSASNGNHFFWSQLRNSVAALAMFFIFGWLVPLRKTNEYAYWFGWAVFAALLVVLLLGRIAGGAQRWLSLGPIGVQPSEFAKLATALIVARFFSNHQQDTPYRIRDLMPMLLFIGAIFTLIFLQPDFGTAGVCLLIAGVQLLFVRLDMRSIAIVLVSSPLVAAFGWQFLLRPYQKLRVMTLLNPSVDPLNTGYNSLQSMIAVGSGGILGKGYMQGTQAQLKFLPERHTDFVFSVFAEEHGFWGGALIFITFGILTYLALESARTAKDTFSSLLAIGIAAFIFVEFTINIAMVMGLFPVVGLPLPFFSYGGSLLLTICVSLGLLISINRTIRTVSIN